MCDRFDGTRKRKCGRKTCKIEICPLLGYYAALSGSYVPTFRDNLSVPSSRVKKFKKEAFFLNLLTLNMGPIVCPETSVHNYHSTLRNIPEEGRSHLHYGGSLKLRMYRILWLETEGVDKRRVRSFIFHSTTAQAVNRQHLTMDAQVRSQASLYWICSGQSDTGTAFSLCTSILPCQYH
jgi:hypothetical protein